MSKIRNRWEENSMQLKTILGIVLVVFIAGAAVWLNLRKRKK